MRPGAVRVRRAYVQPQPKGVIGNIVPWNFPFDLSVGPLVEMLAAGNRVVIKPSEYTPACARAAARDGPRDVRARPRRRRRRRPRARARVHARALGSPAVHRQPGGRARDRQGRRRAARAGDARARRQVPGDPRPPTASTPRRVKQILGTKAIKNGQMCISVDYCLVPREQLEEFARAGRDVRRARRCPATATRRAAPGSSPPATSSASRSCSMTPASAAATCARSKPAAEAIPTRASCRSRS